MVQSMLSAALAGEAHPSDGSPTKKPSSPPAAFGNKLKASAFPCLYQDSDCNAHDTFKVELDLQRLSMGSAGNRLWRQTRHSLDEPVEEGQRWEKLGSPKVVSAFMGPNSLSGRSLPKAMPPALRQSMGLDTPSPSPHVSSFKDILPEQLSARSAKGRQLRRRILRGTVIVCLVAGYHGKRFIYQRAKELGVRLVILDSADSWGRDLVDEGIIEKFIEIDWDNEAAVFDACVAAIKLVEKDLGQIDGVLSFWELSQPLVARLAEHLGLPGNPPAAVDAARDKQMTRDVMKAAGLPTPANMTINSPTDLPAAAKLVGFPAVLKPTSGAASLGVVKVDSLADLDSIYRRVCKEVASVSRKADGSLHTDIDGDAEVIVEQGTGAAYVAQTFIMEQYLDGPEVDVDLVFSGGEAVYGGVTDNWPCIEPYFNETGSNCPSTLPAVQQRALCELAVAASQAMGFQLGVLHAELKYTSHGPHIIEVNARMGGGPVATINKMVWGVDLVEEQLLTTAGIPTRPYLATRPEHFLAEYSVNAKRTGIIKTVDFCNEWEGKEDIIYCRPLVTPREKVVAIEDGMPTWLYEVMATKPTVEEAIDFVKRIEVEIEPSIRIEPRKSKTLPVPEE